MLGQPHSNTLEELMRECQKCKDSLDNFEAWNSGLTVMNSSKELDFVLEPFETPEGWQDQDPKDWKPKHEYEAGPWSTMVCCCATGSGARKAG